MSFSASLVIGVVVLGLAHACIRVEPPTGEQPNEPDGRMNRQNKTHLFAITGDWPPYSYINEVTGASEGFMHMLIAETCRVCGRQCDIVLIKSWSVCWDGEELSADGLMDRHFDACPGYSPTFTRMNVLKFAGGIQKDVGGQIYARADSGITSMADLSKGKLGVRKFWNLQQDCLRARGFPINDDDVVMREFGDWSDMIDALRNGDFEAVLVQTDSVTPENMSGLVAVGDVLYCKEGPSGVMSRKDVDMEWFAQCLRELQSDGTFSTLCRNWNIKDCVDVYAPEAF
ncbi:unnamed protein product [Owenia fusiformis]|uniref:Uncharacterized protein n=1 Tax=Owenia fusiformis TaxID=6347 RepID=A0A8J1XSH2_OWEFU|nr:unnamed protein product [Owenia fusiformis]